MKYLALTLLLALGSQAVPVPTDDVSTLDQVRNYVNSAVQQTRAYIDTAMMDVPEGTEKAALKRKIDERFQMINAGLTAVRGWTDSALETTKPMRDSAAENMRSLRDEIQPKFDELKNVIQKHMEEYKSELRPIISEYNARHRPEMENLRAELMSRLEPVIAPNLEETRVALRSIGETLSTRGTGYLEQVKEHLMPYVAEYREQMRAGASDLAQRARSTAEGLPELRQRVEPKIQALAARLQEMAGELVGTINGS